MDGHPAPDRRVPSHRLATCRSAACRGVTIACPPPNPRGAAGANECPRGKGSGRVCAAACKEDTCCMKIPFSRGAALESAFSGLSTAALGVLTMSAKLRRKTFEKSRGGTGGSGSPGIAASPKLNCEAKLFASCFFGVAIPVAFGAAAWRALATRLTSAARFNRAARFAFSASKSSSTLCRKLANDCSASLFVRCCAAFFSPFF